ncbi:amino acid adenylation domain-containing protein [Streptomyces sp. GS7]|uniref:amino acid adenylation domain-containing protein n=1 Tax=Streptomyces sp. GS7 TaxID=2692234 RepID=UPI0013184C2B|nr:amino acid adenylation domain-containing protein [Streptomyces sp. GS7]QHC24540.1 amino acid adenylation domain-containing protein [Streptomyces sp. GS7]
MTVPREHPGPVVGAVREVAADSLVRMVRHHARTRPHAIAVESADRLRTYGQLWHRSLVIAAGLDEAGVGPGDRVALWADRTGEVLAAALAVMMLRASYVPIDPTHPKERVSAVLSGASPAALVHDNASATAGLLDVGVPVVDVSELKDIAGPPDREPPRPDDIAYVIFTSGSTGSPKGVQVEHASLANYPAWCGWLVGRSGSGSPLFASLGYDLAMTSMWVPLAHGHRVVTVEGLWDQETLFGPRRTRHTFIKLTPSHARFFEALEEPPDYASITQALMFGGEGLDVPLIRSLGSRIDGVRLINHYGPTETAVGCCAYRFDSTKPLRTPTVPIGTPAWNSRAYVVDDQLRPVPAGTPGELVIAGRSVAAGYLGQPAGAGRFMDERDLGGGSGRAYRTGDLVEVLPEGTLLYLGRQDDQLNPKRHGKVSSQVRGHFKVNKSAQSQHRRRHAGEQVDSRRSCGGRGPDLYSARGREPSTNCRTTLQLSTQLQAAPECLELDRAKLDIPNVRYTQPSNLKDIAGCWAQPVTLTGRRLRPLAASITNTDVELADCGCRQRKARAGYPPRCGVHRPRMPRRPTHRGRAYRRGR